MNRHVFSQKHTSPHGDVDNIDDGEDDEGEEGINKSIRTPEPDWRSQEGRSLLHPEEEDFHLPRSSPVISRRRRSVSWHGRNTDDEPSLSSSHSPSSASGALSLSHGGSQTALTTEDPAGAPSATLSPRYHSCTVQEHKKPRCISLSSNLNRLLSIGLHLPFSGQQGLAEMCQGRGLSSSDSPPTPDIFRTSCELEKENAHFIVVDMVLEVLEGAKWKLSLNCGIDKILTHRGSLRRSWRCPTLHTNVEWLAQQLVLGFRRSWFPSHEPRRGRHSLRTLLQELPGTGAVVVSGGSLTEEIKLRTRMRGSLSWAPPRFQIIFTVQPTHRRSDVVTLQHFLCAGCGTEVEPRYIKKLRYCEYLGKYFCDCCHGGSEAVIPSRVLSDWDFGRYSVSDFSKQLLDSVWHQPLFDLTSVGKTLYGRVKELDRFRELQQQLLGIKKLLTTCRLSDGVMIEFEQLPGHLTQQPNLFSMDDLLRVKRGQLVPLARAVLLSATDHVDNCELCLARGFICEFCREREVIFPFQSDSCKRCPVCKACFHKNCFMEKNCPKCARILSRRKLLDGSSLDP
ncbi:protein associated with UVRAG as autophagy enhancer [Diretmus argenteus]